MVAKVSNHDAEFIMEEMPLARAMQFRTIYWNTVEGWRTVPLGEDEQPRLSQVII